MKPALALTIVLTAIGGVKGSVPLIKQDHMPVKYHKVVSTDFFKSENFEALMKRLDNIQPSAARHWGQMNIAQMLHHLNLAIGSGIGYYELEDKSTLRSRGIEQFIVLNVLRRFPMETQTPATLKAMENYDFQTEKERLKEILKKAYATKSNRDWGKHTYFGKMSRKNWGKLILIHCNHHFQQFSN